MTKSVGYAQSDGIVLRDFLRILHTEVELIVVHLGCVVLGKRVGIRIGVRVDNRATIVAPELCSINTDSEALERTPAQTQVNLMQAARTRICIGGFHYRCASVCAIERLSVRI